MNALAMLAVATLTWVNATQNTDGTSIPASGTGSLTNTIVEYGTCAGAAFGTKQGEITVAAPAQTADINMVVVQQYCFQARHTNTFGSVSGPSNVAMKANPAPVPNPPAGLTTVGSVAYNLVKVPDGFAAVPVGTVPSGVPCDTSVSVNGMNIVPVASVVKSPGVNVELVMVVARCG